MLDSLRYFNRKSEFTKDGHVEVTAENRAWERFYKRRWHHDKEVRSTHGVNCTGSCSWRVFVKNGVVTWEIQETNYPRTRPDIPNHEPRGCPRGASYSWYLYSSARIKHPMIRASLFDAYKKAKKQQSDPVKAWEHVMLDPAACSQYKSERGLGGLIRLSWDDALEITAAANIYTIKKYGPDRVAGFTPIPAFSMVSYSSGTRYLSLIGGACLSFYDFYCDLPPASPQTWGEQTDVPESADWFTSTFLMLWGSNV
ncbi:MAG: molybdopterin-dependent oxidoreductase, partial [Tannerellaceae bacterium]